MDDGARTVLVSLALLVACGGDRASVEPPRTPEQGHLARRSPGVAVAADDVEDAGGAPSAATMASTSSAAGPDPVARPEQEGAALAAASPDPLAAVCPGESDAPVPLTAAIAAGTNPRWTAEPIAAPFRYGPDDGIAIVALGQDDVLVSVVATGTGLVAARRRHGTWSAEVVDPAAGRGDTSLVRDSRGRVHVSYRSQDGALRHAWQHEGGWRVESIDRDGHLAASNAIAIDGHDVLTVAYYDEDRHLLEVARQSPGGRWETEVVGHGGGQYALEVSLAIDPRGRPHVVHSDADAGTVRYAVRDETGWRSVILDSRLVQGHTAIAFDPRGRAVVAYYDTGESELVVARWSGSCWQRRVVVKALEVSGGWPSLAVGSDDRIHVAYFQGTREGTQYVVGRGDRWSIETIDAGNDSGPWVGLTLDPAGRPWVAHGNARGGPRLCVR